jgi:hypothetical protein
METLIAYLVRFVEWTLRRPFLKIRIIKDEPNQPEGGLQFEVENASPTLTSLYPVVAAKFLYPEKGRYRRGTVTFDVRELDRELPPFKAKIFSASARHVIPGYGFAWFRVYRFCPSRGVPRRVRIRSAMLESLSPLRFWFELWRFRLFGRVVKCGPTSLHEYQAIKRSQGPH